MRLHLALLLSIFALFAADAMAVTMDEIAGIYVGQRVQMVPGPGGDLWHFDEVAIYQPDGAYIIWLQDRNGAVFSLQGYISFNSDGTWSDSNGSRFRAAFHGNTLVAFIDWRTVGEIGVVHSSVHRVDTLPESFRHSPHP
jgi:hypothetical protein